MAVNLEFENKLWEMADKLRGNIQPSDYKDVVLSMLFNNRVNPVLVESDKERQVYDLTTNTGECRIFIKYRTNKISLKNQEYNSWLFVLSGRDKDEINRYLKNEYNLVLALVCGVSGLSNSEIAIIDKDQLNEIISLGKSSITISRKKNERAYRISIGGGRENAMQIKCNRFEEMF